MLRLATWNVERPNLSEATRRARLLTAMQTVQADIWVLTETHTERSLLAPDLPLSQPNAQTRLGEPGETVAFFQ